MKLKPQDALSLWREVTVTSLTRGLPDLTQRQFALMLQVYLTPAPHTVRGLAADLKMSKPAVTRAVDRLAGLDFVRRKKDDYDRRSVLIQRTVRGSVYLREFADMTSDLAKSI